MYNHRPNLMIGFHGCDESVRNQLVMQPDEVKISEEKWDWLGHGFYVWENNQKRALAWAESKALRGKIKKPSVVGVVYLLNNCLDFTDSSSIDLLSIYFEMMKIELTKDGELLPKNKNIAKDEYSDLLLRELDCAVIEFIHREMQNRINLKILQKGFSEIAPFDTVRGVFTEGGPAFEGAGIQKKSHIQICIRNLQCIKAFFIPRK